MKSTFRLYNQINSSFFNLIDGTTEVQQTKGLALLFAKSPEFLNTFLKKIVLKSEQRTILKYDEVIINSELTSGSKINNLRCDIVIRLFYKKKPVHCFLIEAKSANKNIGSDKVIPQIDNYINFGFKEFLPFSQEKFSLIVLTKYKTISNDKYFFLTWNEIVNILYLCRSSSREKVINELINDYFNFLTNIKGTMKFYENEVLSIPTNSNTNNLANAYPYIYECPNHGKYKINSKPLYVTFRKSGGGSMDKLFGIDEILILNPKLDYETFIKNEDYDISIRDRVKKYFELIDLFNVDEEKQFLILSETNVIELNHKPKPLKNNSYRAYYQLSDILKNNIVGLK